MMGDFTATLRQRLRADTDVPDIIAAMLRLGASHDFRGIAVPIFDDVADIISGFELWLASVTGVLGLAAKRSFKLEVRIGGSFNVWQLRRMQQRITGMTSVESGHKAFGIWRVISDFGDERPTVMQTGPDLQLVRIAWPDDERWCSVAPINPQVRRTGL